jgi:ABC-2 type transport system ATP-binding protein
LHEFRNRDHRPRQDLPEERAGARGIDLNVEAGTIFGLLGPNGAGKSTTLKILTTLARADEGTAVVAGHDVARAADRVRRVIGVVGQKPGVDPDATVRENIVLQGDLYGLPPREVRKRADELLARFGLSDAARRLVRTYSGGMQRKLDVAMGLINSPEVLFLDEPTTGLDPEARAETWEGIERLAARSASPCSSRPTTWKRPTGWPPGSRSSIADASSLRGRRTR